MSSPILHICAYPISISICTCVHTYTINTHTGGGKKGIWKALRLVQWKTTCLAHTRLSSIPYTTNKQKSKTNKQKKESLCPQRKLDGNMKEMKKKKNDSAS